ncbi:MAG: hypothetical protein SOR93_07355 [Clostridiales Family XIII bacterium]|nr:hypothetical protein [Clostridia bacterium]MDE8733871.1 hypothetical protein [Eubacteriales bacterium DFI.9.88]MDY3011055.1 hypothetical protein [Clostridiales Family XIII bacterium]
MLKIFSEASKDKGFGHFVRMSSICEELLADNVSVILYLDADQIAKQMLAKNYVRFYNWTNNSNAISELEMDDYVLVDSYNVNLEFLEEMHKHCRELIIIDDNNRLDYHNMIIINPNYFGETLNYPQQNENVYFVGKDCTLLRKEFVFEASIRTVNKTVKRVLITFGGTDVFSATYKVIERIKHISEQVQLDVVATKAFSNLENIKKLLSIDDKLHLDIDARSMSLLMKTADFAVASAGGTTNELIKMQCPSVLMIVADNQKLNADYLKKMNMAEFITLENMDSIKKMFSYQHRLNIVYKLAEKRSEKSAIDIIKDLIRGA